ncbi:MAG TPA: transporter substrate-binding domain-containing protein [Vicinamibacterales bacterium]
MSRRRLRNDSSRAGISGICLLLWLALFLSPGCKKAAPGAEIAADQTDPAGAPSEPPVALPQADQDVEVAPNDPPPPARDIHLPLPREQHTGDLGDMVKRRAIRALVVINPIGFFYDAGLPRGVMFEALQEFQKFVNKKLNTGTIKVAVTFVPVRFDQLEAALTEGTGDLIAYPVAITPERSQRVAFSSPLHENVQHIIVTAPDFGPVSSLEDLGGREVYANPLTSYYQNLQKANETLRASGHKPIVIRAADTRLSNDDLIEMVNAGLIPATVTTQNRAELWSQVLKGIKPNPKLVIAKNVQVAMVMRKNSPQLKALVDEFVGSHAVGTSFGNTLLRRYLQNTKWVDQATSTKHLAAFRNLDGSFRTYGRKYEIDYLLLAAQGYQESKLNQALKSPAGAVGVMQVIPRYAAASPINIPNVAGSATANINAGAKMLRHKVNRYFDDPAVDSFNRVLFALASYNAGPTRIAGLRKQTASQGLNPNLWFENVELVAARAIGQETVNYVRNVYKYYVAYKLSQSQTSPVAESAPQSLPNIISNVSLLATLAAEPAEAAETSQTEHWAR